MQVSTGPIQGTIDTIQGTFGTIQGTFGTIKRTFGTFQETFGTHRGTFGSKTAYLVGDPLLVHLLVEARRDAHHFRALGVHADVAAQRVGDIHRLGQLQLPRAGGEGVRLGGEGPDRAEIDNIGGHVARQEFADVRADLRVTAATRGAEILRERDDIP